MVNKGAGRPYKSYKYSDPENGKPITAIQYHKLMKDVKKLKRDRINSNNFKISKQLDEKSENTIDTLIEIRQFINNLIKRELN